MARKLRMFGGMVIDGDENIDPDLLWMWQKARDDGVYRVTATTLGDVTITQDVYGSGVHHSLYRAIYLDGDCIDAINYAKGLVDELPNREGISASVGGVQAHDGGTT